MRFLPLIALALLVSFSASSFANNYKVLGNYKELDYLVEGVPENSLGVTKKDLERTVKLRLMKNGIKPITVNTSKHWLYLNVNFIETRGGYATNISVELKKRTYAYVSPDNGASTDHLPFSFLSGRFFGITAGSTKSGLLENVEFFLDNFILQYLEANME